MVEAETTGKEEPLVSVMITSYNQRDALKRAVDSVLAQTYPNIQIVISDDFSTKDDSREVIMAYHAEHGDRIKPILQPHNVGIPKNKNTGYRACDGELITYLDGDDFYYPEKIAGEVAALAATPSAGIAYSNFVFTDLDGRVLRPWLAEGRKGREGRVFQHVFARDFPYRTLYRCELMRREVLEAINYYDETLGVFEDWDSRIRMTSFADVVYSDTVGCAYVDDPAGISKQERKSRLYETMVRIWEKNRPLLNATSPSERNFVTDRLEYLFSLKQFATYPDRRTFGQIARHLKRFSRDIVNPEIWAYLLLNERQLEFLRRKKNA